MRCALSRALSARDGWSKTLRSIPTIGPNTRAPAPGHRNRRSQIVLERADNATAALSSVSRVYYRAVCSFRIMRGTMKMSKTLEVRTDPWRYLKARPKRLPPMLRRVPRRALPPGLRAYKKQQKNRCQLQESPAFHALSTSILAQ